MNLSEEIEMAPQFPAGMRMRGLVVVVIDDEIIIRNAMSILLSGWGHDVVTAASGDEAMRALATVPVRPDLVISDLRLRGGETGIAVIGRLRSIYGEAIPAMLVTGDTAPNQLAEAQTSGFVLLHKPVSVAELRTTIANLIATAATTILTGEDTPDVK